MSICSEKRRSNPWKLLNFVCNGCQPKYFVVVLPMICKYSGRERNIRFDAYGMCVTMELPFIVQFEFGLL